MTWRIDSGYIGCCYREEEFEFFAELLRDHGIPVKRVGKYSTMGLTISLYTSPEFVRRAREIRRGFKSALLIRGDVMDFLLGIRAALHMRPREKGKLLCEHSKCTPRRLIRERCA